MPRISKRTREAAIEACLEASAWWADRRGVDDEHPCDLVADDARNLAFDAFAATLRAHEDEVFPRLCSLCYLEAAALLRGDDEHEPWSPGDETYLLAGRLCGGG
jgi:hypothetical protein